MRRYVPRWLAARAEHFGLGVALAVIAALVVWWAIFAFRMISLVHDLSSDNARYALRDDPAALQRQLEAISGEAQRQFWMIEGESSLFALLLFMAVSFLFLIARRHRQARIHVERQLQFTTHELKTPIAGVRALLQTMRRGAVPPELLPELLGQGLEACDRLEHITETMLACQRAAAGRVHPQVLSASDLVEGVLAHRATSGNAEKAEVELGPEVLVRADPDAFRVILENLLDNARKYASGAVRIAGTRDGRTWSLAVIDDGPGLTPEDAAAIFEPFVRRPHEGVAHGSGLGLALSRELARDMGGDLRAESRPKGAVFLLDLPIATAPRPALESGRA